MHGFTHASEALQRAPKWPSGRGQSFGREHGSTGNPSQSFSSVHFAPSLQSASLRQIVSQNIPASFGADPSGQGFTHGPFSVHATPGSPAAVVHRLGSSHASGKGQPDLGAPLAPFATGVELGVVLGVAVALVVVLEFVLVVVVAFDVEVVAVLAVVPPIRTSPAGLAAPAPPHPAYATNTTSTDRLMTAEYSTATPPPSPLIDPNIP